MHVRITLIAFAISWIAITGSLAQVRERPDCRSNAGPEFVEYYKTFDKEAYRQAMGRYLREDRRAVPVQYAVQIHIVRRDDGTGGENINTIRDEFADWINPYFADVDIEFVECAPEIYHNSTEYFSLSDDAEGDAMSVAWNVADVINIYYVGDPDGACGWARFPWKLPSDYIVIANGCSDNHSTTVHELGHYFGLLHTHETANGAENVTRNSGDGCWNCEEAGDLLCDTDADPDLSDLAYDYPNCAYFGTGTDACNDDSYTPDIDNIMSYADKYCRDVFTPEQLARMAYYRDNDRDYLQTGCPCDKPVASCRNIIVNLNPAGNASITPVDVDNGSTYDCGLDTWSVSPSSFNCSDVGQNVVTLTIIDDLGWESTCQATVTVADVTDPTITTAAAGMTVECDGSGNVAQFQNWLNARGGASASDACGGSWSNNSTGLSDGCGATGSETVTFTYTDPSGNSASTMATFTIEDTTQPSVTCPADIHLPECVETASWTVIAGDACGDVTVVSDPPSGSSFPKGSTTIVEVTVTDACGLVNTCTFTVTRDPDLEVAIDPLGTSPLPTCAAGSGAHLVLGYGGGPTCVTLNAVGAGGHAPYTYAWTGPAGLPAGSLTDENTASPTFCPDYQTAPCVTYVFEVTVTDIHGCTETAQVEVNVVNPLCTSGKTPKVNICHRPPDNPANEQTNCVSANAVATHLNDHDDCLGACDDVCVLYTPGEAITIPFGSIDPLTPQELTALPNPFTHSTEVRFRAATSTNARLEVMDATGRILAILHDGPVDKGATYQYTFDVDGLSAGIYIARLTGADGSMETVKMSLVK